jgi:hypothetical protein
MQAKLDQIQRIEDLEGGGMILKWNLEEKMILKM